jgi:Secretion system C-terminal sorting domain
MNSLKKSLAIALVLASFAGKSQVSISQNISTDNNKLKIHVEKEEKGKKEVFDKTFDVKGMSESEKQAMIDHITDSLTAGSGNNMKMRIKVDRNQNDDKVVKNGKKNEKKRVIIKKDGQTIEKSLEGDDLLGDNEEINIEIDGDNPFDFKMNGRDFDFKDFENKLGDMGKTLQFKFDQMEPMIKKFGDDMEPKFRKFRDGNFLNIEANSSKTIMGLSAFPNKPNNNKLNVKFEAPQKGDVTIRVTDLNGKEIGSEKISGFEGEYIGQVDLKGNAKGTVFVTVVQGDDGSTKRVVLN